MKFHEKLNQLMQTLNISNSRLSKALAVDPSLISRWRSGTRAPAQHSDYYEHIAEYMVIHAKLPSQKIAICEVIGCNCNEKDFDSKTLGKQIENWFRQDENDDWRIIQSFLRKLSTNTPKAFTQLPTDYKITFNERPFMETETFHGIEGKREAVLLFLEAVLVRETPTTLFLYSDERMSWLTDDPLFTQKWAHLLKNVILRGNKIVIVHTVQRNLEEMLDAIEKWLPLYMTGAIEPYYNPHCTDGLFKRTQFLVPETIAMTSESVSAHEDLAIQLLHRNLQAVQALVTQYKEMLKRCRPLMKIYTLKDLATYQSTAMAFAEQNEPLYTLSDSLSSWTMPSVVFKSITQRLGLNESSKNQWFRWHQNHMLKTLDLLEHHTVYEVITLPKSIDAQTVSLPSDLFVPPDIYYSKEDYCSHLLNMVNLLEKHASYHVLLTDEVPHEGLHISVKKSTGVMVVTSKYFPTVFNINQNEMTQSFHNYLQHIIEKNQQALANKKSDVIHRIKSFVHQTLKSN